MALQDISKSKRITVVDLCVILAVLTTAIFMFIFAMPDDSAAALCIIEVDGEEFARYDLPLLKEEKIITIDNIYGKNTIVIDKDGAKVTESDCADKIEIISGKIEKPGQSLICLPHRLTVRLEGADEVDGTTW